MKIRVLYEEHIKNGHKGYTTIDIPDGDYSVMLDIDYEQRLAEAKPEKKAEVKRCETVQEMFDLMNLYPFLMAPFVLVFPIITYLVAEIKKS